MIAHRALPKGVRRQRGTLGKARRLRSEATEAEKLLWSRIRRGQVCGFRFRRQYPIGPFIADFCCARERLIVELDGGHHGLQESSDRRRTKWLESQGFRVIRYVNGDVFRRLEDVVRDIEGHLRQMQD